MLDNGEPSLRSTSRVVVCILDINDNAPTFSHKLFNVRLPERPSPASPGAVYRLVASDPDDGLNGSVTYSIEESDEEGFSIDPVTGVVSSSSTFTAGEYNILTVSGQWGQGWEGHCWLGLPVVRVQEEGGSQAQWKCAPLLALLGKTGSLAFNQRIRLWAFLFEGRKGLGSLLFGLSLSWRW